MFGCNDGDCGICGENIWACSCHTLIPEQPEPEGPRPKFCGRCYDKVDELFPANCNEKPELLIGQPLGQYHCPDCGAMVLAGMVHFELCKQCIDRNHPAIDEQKV